MAGRHRNAPTLSGEATSAAFETLTKGRLGYTNLNSDIAGLDDSLNTILTVNGVSINSSRTTVVRGFCQFSVDADDAHSTVSLTLWQGATQIGGANYRLPPNANEQQACWVECDATGSAGTFDFFLRAQRVHGSQTLTAQGATTASGFLIIEDATVAF